MSQSHCTGISATIPTEFFPDGAHFSTDREPPRQLPVDRRTVHRSTHADRPARRASVDKSEVPSHAIDRDDLFADFKPLVQRLLRQYGTDPDLREELVGEIYFRFCALLDAYESSRGVPLRAYLVKQLSVSVYTYVRHHWRLHRRESPIDLSLEECNVGWLDDPTPSWIDGLFVQQIREALPAAFAELPKRQLQVLVWRYYDERSFEDIAGDLGVQPATARSLLRHAVTGLRRRLVDLHPADGRKLARHPSKPGLSPCPRKTPINREELLAAAGKS